jgi:nitrate reductase beta subunit
MKKQNDHGKGGYGRSGKDDPMPVLRSADLADCIEIARVSAIILTLNRTEDEEVRGWVRVFLEKQRRGRKAITYGVKAKYANSNLIINDYYEPHGLVHKLADDKDEVEKNDAETSLSQTTESKPATFSTELSLKDAVAASNSQNPEEQKYNDIML